MILALSHPAPLSGSNIKGVKVFKVKIYISLKKGVADPQGITIKGALESLGYQGIEDVRMGKFVEVRLNTSDRREAEKKLREMCEKLLVNPVIEQYSYEIQDICGG